MLRKKMRTGWKIVCLLVAICLALAIGAQISAANAAMMSGKGVYYSDFESISALKEEAAKLSQKIGDEGMTLLKNKGGTALPLDGDESVNVFGVMSDKMLGSAEVVADVLADEGFRVNKVLADYYVATNTTSSGQMGPGSGNSEIGNEKVEKDFPAYVKSSMNLYKDLAVIVISRDGAEGDDLALVTNEAEDNDYIGKDQGWKHKDLFKKTEGEGAAAKTVEYKHYLQLTESEEELIGYAKSMSKKVVVVLNTSNVIEVSNLQNDDGIDGIVWIGRTGDKGLSALAKILNGKLSPSGRTSDIWTADHTADPTWINYATGAQVDNIKNDPDGKNYSSDYVPSSSQKNNQVFYRRITDKDGKISYKSYRRADDNKYMSGPDMFYYYAFSMYEEGIYMGYRYYETAHADKVAGFDYDKAVVYPFGFGLSYTTFEWTDVTPASELVNWSSKKTLNIQVEVKNTGKVASKDVVQIYAHAPFTKGEVERPEVQLVGFGKTSTIQPGLSETITISVNVQDMANFDDYDKNKNGSATYEFDAGTGYELRLQANSHEVKETIALSDLASDVILGKDDFSGNDATALFSGKDEYNSLGYDPSPKDKDGKKPDGFSLKDEGKYVEMTRGNFDTTFPDAHSMWELARSDDFFSFSMGRDLYVQDTSESAIPKDTDLKGGVPIWNLVKGDHAVYAEDESDTAKNQQPWVMKASEFAKGGKYASWTQAASAADQKTDAADWINYFEMAGIDRNDDAKIIATEGKFANLTGAKAWDKFMNQLTFTELVITVSNITNKPLASVKAPKTPANDSPKNLGSTFDWGCLPHLAATFNENLTYQQGIIVGSVSLINNTGWYAPGMNTHRTAFGGRNNEYYSQEGLHAGIMGAAAVRGAQSKGCATYIKHFALNDQETGRVRCAAIATEQAAREIYFKPFQLAIQEGNAQHLMASMGNLGDAYIGTSYNVMTKMLKQEWGFTGMSATDAYVSQLDNAPMDLMIRTGMEAPLGDQDKDGAGNKGTGKSYMLSGAWDKALNTVVIADGADNAKRTSYTQWYWVRRAAETIMFANVNSNYVLNGVDTSKFIGTTLTAGVQGQSYKQSVASTAMGTDAVTYSLASGSLPNGLSISSNGEISGTPTVPGSYTFSVKVLVANYISSTQEFKIAVQSAFKLENDISTDSLKVGTLFDTYIESQYVKASDDTTITYEIKSGKLPDGITLGKDDGKISGTPTESGEFPVTILVTSTKTTQGSKGTSTTKTTYDYNLTLKIAAGEAPVIDKGSEVRVKDGMIQYQKDDGTWVDISKVDDVGKADDAGGGCNSMIAGTTGVILALIIVGTAILIIMKKRTKEQD